MHLRDDLIERNVEILGEGLQLISQLDNEIYLSAGMPFSRGGIGSHLRHCLEFYQVFLGSAATGRVDYDARPRDLQIDNDSKLAVDLGFRIMDRLRSHIRSLPSSIQVRHDGGSWCSSSVDRELQFLLSHTVHHFSIIAIALKLNGIEPGSDFGVAPSTLAHSREAA